RWNTWDGDDVDTDGDAAATPAPRYDERAAAVGPECDASIRDRVGGPAEIDFGHRRRRVADLVSIEVLVVDAVETAAHQAAVSSRRGHRVGIGLGRIDDAILGKVGDLPLVELIGRSRRRDEMRSARVDGDI